MRHHHDLRFTFPNGSKDRGIAQMMAGGVDQAQLVSRIEQRSADHQQSQRKLVTNPIVTDGTLQRAIYQDDAHGFLLMIGEWAPAVAALQSAQASTYCRNKRMRRAISFICPSLTRSDSGAPK